MEHPAERLFVNTVERDCLVRPARVRQGADAAQPVGRLIVYPGVRSRLDFHRQIAVQTGRRVGALQNARTVIVRDDVVAVIQELSRRCRRAG